MIVFAPAGAFVPRDAGTISNFAETSLFAREVPVLI